VARAVQQQDSVVEHPPGREPMTTPGTSSCIGSVMSIVGNIECNGPAQVYGRVRGELRASDLLIGDGAQIEGSVIAQDVTVCGRVKGTIRAVRVKLQDGGAVEGDIFHRSLSSTRTLCLKDRHGELKNLADAPSVNAKAHGKRTYRARSGPRICSALKHRHPLSGPSRRLSRSIRAHMPGHCPAVAPPRRMHAATSRLCCVIFIVNTGATASSRAEMPTPAVKGRSSS
jgi:cytoskeletal protein CcmA (bactofilin family)